MAGEECRLTTATRSVTGTCSTKWEECVVTLLRGTLWTAWQWHESVNMPVFTAHPSLFAGLPRLPTLQFNFHTKGETCSRLIPLLYRFAIRKLIRFAQLWNKKIKKYDSVRSRMVDELNRCPRLLLSLMAANRFYITQSTPSWLHSELTLRLS